MKIAFTYRDDNYFSKLVRKITKSEWSHTFIIMDDYLSDDEVIFESAFGHGVHLNLLSKYIDNPHVGIKVFEVDEGKALHGMKKLIGKRYGYFQSVGFLIKKLFNMDKNPSKQGQWCSELVLTILLETSDANLFKHLPMNSASPEDIYQILMKHPDIFKVSSI